MLGLHEHLRLYDSGKQQVWRSEEPFGGTLTHIDGEDDTAISTFKFISSPIYLTDVNEDGEMEVMVCKNSSRVGRLFGKFRLFSSGT